MEPNQGRLQTAEHILARILENQFEDLKIVIAWFSEDFGILEVNTSFDLRHFKKSNYEKDVNDIIKQNLNINIFQLRREEANGFDLSRIKKDIPEIRIVEIESFDKRPCADNHVSNTIEIGLFKIQKIKRVGKNRYRIRFIVQD